MQRRSRDLSREARSGLADLIDQGAIRGEEPWRSLLVHHLQVFRETSDFREVLVLDANGAPLFGDSTAENPAGPETRALAARAREAAEAVRSDFYRCPDCGGLHLEFAQAIRDPEGRVLGFLSGRLSAEDLLFPHLLRWPTTSESAEILLVRVEGDEVTFLSPLRHRPEVPAGSLRLPVARFRRTGGMVGPGPEGPWQGMDYRGEEVLAHARPVPDTPWILIAQMDRTEALAPSVPVRRNIEALALLAIAFAAAIGMWVHRLGHARILQGALEQERALRLELSESEAILQGIGDGVIATDREGRIRRINPIAAELTGWSPGEALGHPLADIFRIRNEETGAPVENPVTRVLATGKIVGLANHTELVARDGTARPIADSGAPVRDDQGNLWGVVLVFRDQSETRERERKAREVSERFERFFMGLRHGAALGRLPPGTTDPLDLRWVAVNPTLARLLGRTVQEVEGLRPADLLGEAWSRWVDLCPHLDDQKPIVIEEDWPLDPERRVVLTLFRTAPGECVTLVEDVTDIRRAERERQRMEAVAAQQQRLEAVGTLAAGVAHEINNPVQAISNYAEVLARHPDDAQMVREFAPAVGREAERIAEIVRSLLGLARQGSDGISTVRVDHVWERALVLVRTLLQKEGIVVRVEVAPDLPVVRCRPTQVLQILINLLVNARDALTDSARGPEKARQVTCRSEVVVLGDRRMIRFEVRDNGPGIPDDVQKHLFQPFFTSKGRERGTGIGLWFSRRIAEEHGGSLRFESTPGEGTAFFLDLPLEEEPDGEGAGGR